MALRAPRAHRQRPGIPLQALCQGLQRLGLKHSFARAYRPQTNGKAERFIQSAPRECAHGIPYNRSTERADMLERWTHHYAGIAPIRASRA